jgi:hypothetical protein
MTEIQSTNKRSALAAVRISSTDADDLRWYFRDGLKRLEQPSNMQAQLDRLSLYFHCAKPCTDCGGDVQKSIAGCGWIPTKSKGRPPTDWERSMLGMLDCLPPAADKLCPKCEGKGWVEGKRSRASRGPQTARPTGSSKHGNPGREVGGSESLARLGRVSRRLAMVRERSYVAAGAIAAYYSPDGGDFGALWHLTPAGRKMLKANPHGLPHQQLFANLREAQTKTPTDGRRAQFDAANEQARELYQHAVEVWGQVVGNRQSIVDELGETG